MVVLFSSIAFFGTLFFKDSVGTLFTLLTGASPLAIVVFLGGVQNCCCKGCKYSVFDASKEMAFVPLDHETKLKGKAAIDGVGSRFGKFGGSLIHQGLLIVFSSLTASAPVVGIFVLLVIAIWITSVRMMARQFQELGSGEKTTSSDEKTVLVSA